MMSQRSLVESSENCPHKNFEADVSVNRNGDGTFTAAVSIGCKDCHQPFVFPELAASRRPWLAISPAEPK
jgi:hypothetical protein